MLPEGLNMEKDRALRHGQLGSSESGPVLSRALHSTESCLEGKSGCLHWLLMLCPSWLLLLVKSQGARAVRAMLRDAPAMHQRRLGPGFCLLPFSSLCLPRCGTRGLPDPLQMKPKAHPAMFIPSFPSKYVTAFSEGLYVCPGCMFCVGE